MRMLNLAGNFLAALGLLCGVFLLLSPLTSVIAWGLLLSGKTLALGLLFVLLSWLGLVLGGLGGSGKAAADRLLFRLGSGWLVLGVLAIVALVSHLVGLLNAEVTLIWWLMAAGCSAAGGIAVTMGSDARSPQS